MFVHTPKVAKEATHLQDLTELARDPEARRARAEDDEALVGELGVRHAHCGHDARERDCAGPLPVPDRGVSM